MKKTLLFWIVLCSIVPTLAQNQVETNKTHHITVSNKQKTDLPYIKQGYRWLIEWTNTFGISDFTGDFRTEIATIHGAQFNQYTFVGGGVGVGYYCGYDEFSIPLFADIRVDFFDKATTPYVDLRVGYAISSDSSAYIAPTLGIRFLLRNKMRCNFGLGYSYSDCIGGISLRIGLDF